ncbi:hypothetical protein LTR85_009124 [Meristemomyces frigidus]|nr:hypothetical protein LTR85_009124 [Meristemomyces frigidus]
MPFMKVASGVLALALATRALAQDCSDPDSNPCQSYGIDFVSGGTYFQNILSTDPFTAVQEFEGCQNDTSDNILVDPNGNQYECSTTPLTPDDTPETVICPLEKDELTSGEWSLIVISNNGGACPIAYERDFSLIVGEQQTSTIIPTITIDTAYTPVVSATVTVLDIITATAQTSTITVPKLNLQQTITIHPQPAYSVVTKPILTFTSTEQIPNVVATSTVQATASCQLPQRRHVPDPIASIVPSILGNAVEGILSELGINLKARDAAPQPTARSASTEFKRAIIDGRAVDPKVKAEYLEKRRERLALNKRAPDLPTVTVTDSSAISTITSTTSTAATSTLYVSSVSTSTSWTTPLKTVSLGVAFGITTVTGSQQTITNTVPVLGTQVVYTQTSDVVLTITSTSTPAAVAASCSSVGGTLS